MSSSPSRSADLGIALLRAGLGTMWIAHALLKLFVFTLPGTAQYFVSIGFPGWVAYPLFAAELLGGLAIVLGLYARQVALVLSPVMAVVISVHADNGWVHTANGGGWEYPAFLLLASVAIWLAGDGALSLRRSKRLVPSL
ncbi:MAG: DoxX family protein [Burkholderiales bacterium]|nr:DoxX family protein [Burkholderiales bacterium]